MFFRRVGGIYISKTPNGLAVMDLCRLWRWGDFSPFTGRFSRYSTITSIGEKTKDQTDDKAAQEVLTDWISFVGSPDIILADKDPRFIGSYSMRVF